VTTQPTQPESAELRYRKALELIRGWSGIAHIISGGEVQTWRQILLDIFERADEALNPKPKGTEHDPEPTGTEHHTPTTRLPSGARRPEGRQSIQSRHIVT